MAKLLTLKDGFLDELKDLFSAENQLLKALPKLAKKATNKKLKDAFTSHLKETEGQVERLKKIATILEEKLSGKTCKAMQGLIEEGKEIIEEDSENNALIDALLIGAAQRVEHYEIAAYGTACAMSEELGESQVTKLLKDTLNEEKSADTKLSSISEGEVLSAANTSLNIDQENTKKKNNSKKLTLLPSQNKKKPGGISKFLGL